MNDIKALLGKMLFNGAGMEKRVKVLSGGEKARLAMAKFMLTKVRPRFALSCMAASWLTFHLSGAGKFIGSR